LGNYFRLAKDGKIGNGLLIAVTHNSAKVWIAHTEYAITEKTICGENEHKLGLQIYK
jgi:hypothetical protein